MADESVHVSADEMKIESGVDAELNAGIDGKACEEANVVMYTSHSLAKVKPFEFIVDEETSCYSIAGIDEFESMVNTILQRVEDYEYTEDDRKLFKDAKADIVKIRNTIISAIKEEQFRQFGQIDVDRKHIESLINKVIDTLKKSLDASDKAAREAKRVPIETSFNDAKRNDKVFEDTELEDFLDQRWLNRSFAERAAIKELDHRMTQLKDVISLDLLPDLSPAAILNLLRENAWSTTDAVKMHRDEQERIEAKKALEEKRTREAEEARRAREAEAAKKAQIFIEVNSEDVEKVFKLLDASGIEYKRL